MALICFETYDSPQAKRKAQKGAKRGIPTGKANDFLLVDDDDRSTQGQGAIAAVFHQEPGSDCHGLAYTTIGWEYKRDNCRRVGRNHLPESWKKAFDEYLSRG